LSEAGKEAAMDCPLCKQRSLETAELAPGLSGLCCRTCAGTWIPRSRYDAWHDQQAGVAPGAPAHGPVEVTDVRQAKLCPECGRLLLPYRVGHGLAFAIDYCGACGGVWLDRNEWPALQAAQLHLSLHDIVSAHWQSAVRQAGVQAAMEQTYQRLLGPAYARARDVRAWLQGEPHRGLILAYLAEEKRAHPEA